MYISFTLGLIANAGQRKWLLEYRLEGEGPKFDIEGGGGGGALSVCTHMYQGFIFNIYCPQCFKTTPVFTVKTRLSPFTKDGIIRYDHYVSGCLRLGWTWFLSQSSLGF